MRILKKKLKDGMKHQGVISVPGKQNREGGTEAVMKIIYLRIFLELMEDMNPLIQQAQHIPVKKKIFFRHTV